MISLEKANLYLFKLLLKYILSEEQEYFAIIDSSLAQKKPYSEFIK